jgi:hypothetical protein
LEVAKVRAPGNNPTWLRFSLASFLFACLCIGAIVSGYQSGYRNGFQSGQSARYDQTQVSKVYSTASLVWPDLNTEEWSKAAAGLKDLIQTTIATDIWGTGTGNVIYEFPSNQSLMVVAPGSVHREIEQLFAQLESLRSRDFAEQAIPVLQALSSQGKTQDSSLTMPIPKDSKIAKAWLETYYGRTVDGIAERWGAPDFRGECTNAEYPDWSLDQQIAIWPRGKGLAFLALRYREDGQLHIVAGWREES